MSEKRRKTRKIKQLIRKEEEETIKAYKRGEWIFETISEEEYKEKYIFTINNLILIKVNDCIFVSDAKKKWALNQSAKNVLKLPDVEEILIEGSKAELIKRLKEFIKIGLDL